MNNFYVVFLGYKELCSLNSVLYLKQFEIAVADSLGRVKIWDTRQQKEQSKAAMTLLLLVIDISLSSYIYRDVSSSYLCNIWSYY